MHGGLCCCDKAENPKQTAKLLVTSHNKVIYNGEAGKYAATDADKTFDPAAATFGKCTLKPSSAGNQPCALAPAPKWTKPYDKTSIFGNKVLTEISTLQCTIGGKIEVVKSGQTDTVMKEHAENTNPAALALINPAVKTPVLEIAYPSVSNITLKTLKNIPNFKTVSSSDTGSVEKITIRQNEECSFLAKIKKGNVNLTSWVIYDGFTGDKDKRLFTEEQLGTSFKYTFSTIGKYRIEGYGKPKKEDFEGGKYNKNYPDCSIDVEVVLNKLEGTELVPIDGENFAKIIGGKMRLRQNFPASFKAKFLMPPTDSELENLKMYVTDASGNVLKSTRIENTVSFTPINSKAQYKITAVYKPDDKETQTQNFTGETITNSVSEITHDAEVIRPGTPMSFAVKESSFSMYIPDEEEAISKEVQAVKWNLNGRLLGNGKSITIPGHEFMKLGKYVVEAYVTLANAYGQNAKHENDDWHFEVKENDVISFSYNGVPKVGKTTFLEADQLVFSKQIGNEMVVWDTAIPHTIASENTIAIKPLKAGKELVKCRINRQPGKTLSIDVKQAKVLGMLFTDSNGIEIEKSSWYQTVNIWVKQEHLIGEDLTIEIWDNDAFKDDYCKVINVKKYDGNLIPLTLDSYIKNKAGDWGMLYVKIGAPQLKLANENNIFKSKNHLNVEDKREIYSAQIGTQDGKERHYHVDYNKISYFYGKSRGIKAGEKLKITIYEKGKMLFDVKDVTIDTSGAIQAKLQWDTISQKIPSRVVHAVVQDSENKILYEGNKVANGGVHITKTSALQGLAEYKSAVLVKKSESSISKMNNKNCACECEARVRAFMRMLRVGEGTGELIKSWDKNTKEIIYINHDFQKGYTTAFGGNIITDLSTHPQKNYGGSTAAGAYQIMRYTWWWLNGEELDENNLKTGIYKVSHDYIKKYKIEDYKEESQDKICVILMKSQRSNLIKKIIKNDIENAIRKDGCFIWASLPEVGNESHYFYNGVRQPATPMKKCIEHYQKFLKEELLGITNLHLQSGFLSEFNESCQCGKDKDSNQLISCGGKINVDLRKQLTFQAQQTRTDCNITCRKIMSVLNIVPENPTEPGNQSFYQTAIESEDNKKLILNNDDFVKGLNYIDKSLEAGYPVMVGVNHTLNYGYNETPNTSDHYVIIVGRFCDNNVLKYRFWDVATTKGEESDFKFVLTAEKLYSDDVWKKGRTYTLTQVRRNINENGEIIKY
ncbi:PAAR-like protein [Flavobacterium sp. MMS24-S5]|uniref:PAAR-like protein n=1 Tax=Flavobacterium sp. MMS24-S5 TaxID=3416605 RepID=UPI003CFE7DC6